MRKPNYIGDWMIALSLSLTCGYDHIFAYLYPIYLISLDIHRWTRDEHKCSEKYGKDWELYRNRVKWVFCPYIY
jgi:protein-S-isoprenylcysteine O-methyltransferase Ste14